MTFIDNNNPWADDGKRAVAVDKVRAAVNGASANGIGAAKFGSVPPAATELTEEPSAWPILAPEALRGLPGEIVEAATRNSEADPVAVLVTLLAASGCACGRNPYILAGDAFHNARLFAVLVGQSSRGRKGTSEKPIKRLFENCKDAHGYMRWSNGPASTGEGMVYAIRDGDGKEDGDPGIEDKRLFIVEGEFAAVLTVMKRQGNTLSAHLRAFWDGETIEPLTQCLDAGAQCPDAGAQFAQSRAGVAILDLEPPAQVDDGLAGLVVAKQRMGGRGGPQQEGAQDGVPHGRRESFGVRSHRHHW